MAMPCFEEDIKSHCSQLCIDSLVFVAITEAVGEDAVNEESVDKEETFTDAVAEKDGVRLPWAAWWQAARCLFSSFSVTGGRRVVG